MSVWAAFCAGLGVGAAGALGVLYLGITHDTGGFRWWREAKQSKYLVSFFNRRPSCR